VMSISRTLLYSSLWTVIPLPEKEDDDACLSPMPGGAARENGSAAGKPKKQCQPCGYQFTRMTPRGKPLAIKINAVLWCLSGVSMNRLAFLLRVSAQFAKFWVHGNEDALLSLLD
jgi:hypothetical protein